ncbi:hypothetical protein PIB30_061680 [Stylosanthes scabra]|uniref:Uncharacterized protein n=1 Tax=Stylosanthes scabra TaxID=79078 RepID=A0ABU6WKT3_9FABA|nr:hypothetical protein [Stylosanthes scabra]
MAGFQNEKEIAHRHRRYTYPIKATHHTIHIHTNTSNPDTKHTPAASLSPTHSPSQLHSPTLTHDKIARTKTTNRNTGAEIHPPSTRSAQARASRSISSVGATTTAASSHFGKTQLLTEEALPPPPRYRSSGYHSLLHPIVEFDEARPPLYKSFYDEFSKESFSKKPFYHAKKLLVLKKCSD